MVFQTRLGTSKGMLGDDGTCHSIVLEENGSRYGMLEMSLLMRDLYCQTGGFGLLL